MIETVWPCVCRSDVHLDGLVSFVVFFVVVVVGVVVVVFIFVVVAVFGGWRVI